MLRFPNVYPGAFPVGFGSAYANRLAQCAVGNVAVQRNPWLPLAYPTTIAPSSAPYAVALLAGLSGFGGFGGLGGSFATATLLLSPYLYPAPRLGPLGQAPIPRGYYSARAPHTAQRPVQQGHTVSPNGFRPMQRLLLNDKKTTATLFWDQSDVLSNFAKTPFTMQLGRTPCSYNFGEQAFQEAKVRFFQRKLPPPTRGDTRVAECDAMIWKIRNAKSGDDARRIAQQVENRRYGFDGSAWGGVNHTVMEDVVRAKIAQSREARAALLATGNDVLVEASPYDNRWGVGLGANDPRIRDPNNWGKATRNNDVNQGPVDCNKLGVLLMNERARLRGQQPMNPFPGLNPPHRRQIR